jgi:class 3 adenylate cyclase
VPIFLDVHDGLGDATPEDIAAAHRKDLETQDDYGVKWLSYWFNNPDGRSFCLGEAESAEALAACHKAAHGLTPNEIIEVGAPTLAMFMGEYGLDEHDRVVLPNSEPDTGLRVIMFTDIAGSTALSTERGDAAAVSVVEAHDEIVRECLAEFAGSEVKHTGDGILASFASVTAALSAAAAMHERSSGHPDLAIKIGMSAGEPVAGSADIYGAAVNLAARVCDRATGGQTLVAGMVRDLAIGKQFGFADRGAADLKGFPHPVRLFEPTVVA